MRVARTGLDLLCVCVCVCLPCVCVCVCVVCLCPSVCWGQSRITEIGFPFSLLAPKKTHTKKEKKYIVRDFSVSNNKGAGASPKTRRPFSGLLVWSSQVGLVLVWFLIDSTPALGLSEPASGSGSIARPVPAQRRTTPFPYYSDYYPRPCPDSLTIHPFSALHWDCIRCHWTKKTARTVPFALGSSF